MHKQNVICSMCIYIYIHTQWNINTLFILENEEKHDILSKIHQSHKDTRCVIPLVKTTGSS